MKEKPVTQKRKTLATLSPAPDSVIQPKLSDRLNPKTIDPVCPKNSVQELVYSWYKGVYLNTVSSGCDA